MRSGWWGDSHNRQPRGCCSTPDGEGLHYGCADGRAHKRGELRDVLELKSAGHGGEPVAYETWRWPNVILRFLDGW